MNPDFVTRLYPSDDGNVEQRTYLLDLIEQIVKSIDEMKDPNKTTLGPLTEQEDDFYKRLIANHELPILGKSMDHVIEELVTLVQGHPYQNKNFVSNVVPLTSIPAILGVLTTILTNGNMVWDIYSPAGAEAEVKVSAIMSKLVGYDPNVCWGYTTWGGQGTVFTSLRLAIVKHFPRAKEEGVPNHLYCFASELSHYSLLRSLEGTGIGSNHLIKVKTNSDHSMDTDDLRKKMTEVIEKGGLPIYIAATTGTTDSFGIDDIREIKSVAEEVTTEYGLKPVHIHADSAMGGFYCFFNHFNPEENILNFEEEVLDALSTITSRIQYLHLADSLCFDFHKLGQTNYITSLFLVKNGADLKLFDLGEWDTPYIGYRGYGSYHTSYTFECSRAASAISIYASLLAFGVRGYQYLLGNFVRLTLNFRKKILAKMPNVAIVNDQNPGPLTMLRFYPDVATWEQEKAGEMTFAEVESINQLNDRMFQQLAKHREDVFFGDTKKVCLVEVIDEPNPVPVYAVKLFVTSPYTTIEQMDYFVEYLEKRFLEVTTDDVV